MKRGMVRKGSGKHRHVYAESRKNDHGYPGIDGFRLIAAFLIVAIHTSPLASVSEAGDFLLTRVVARVAVPFFFMTSGYFLISPYPYDTGELKKFAKKTVLLYGAAIALYLPVNLYNDYFRMENLLPKIIQDIVFDGTLYHLWYLPASVTGAVIAWYLNKTSGASGIVAACFLYVLGLLGDSYYGIAKQIPLLNTFYELLFQITDYTRNGIFFAPVFFLSGSRLAKQRMRPSQGKLSFQEKLSSPGKPASQGKGDFLGKSLCLAGASLVGMIAEACILRHFGIQRHDSMYVCLLPCTYFLFQALLHIRGKRRKDLRTISLAMYIIHPMMIVVLRGLAKGLQMQELLVENSVVHFLCVSLLSLAFGILCMEAWKKYGTAKPAHTERAYLELNLRHLEHNVTVLQEAMAPGCRLMAVVKAQAYGHGSYAVAACLHRMGVRAFAVATIEEAIQLRRYKITGEILILGYTPPERAKDLRKYDLTQTLSDCAYTLRLNGMGKHIKAHLKIDTGMHRLGFDPKDIETILQVFSLPHVRICGMFTHLCACDSQQEEDIRFTHRQIGDFYRLTETLQERGIPLPALHIQSSYGLLNYPGLNCDYARVGILLYGVPSSPGDRTKISLDLRPVLSLKARVALVRSVKKGDSVGYGRAFVAERDSRIALLSIGYADGYPRGLSCGKGEVLICGRRVPIVGNICMDQLMADVTDIPEVPPGTTATFIGKEGAEEITADEVAESSGTITNEILSRLGERLTTVFSPPPRCCQTAGPAPPSRCPGKGRSN